jgi:choline dehydrogenase-like flavoprotein
MSIVGSHRISSSATIYCDVLIVGSGPGGSVVAQKLVEAGLDVVMIEEGDFATEKARTFPAENLQKLWRNNGLTVAMGGMPLSYAEGRCMGGGSEINSAIIQRISPELLSLWASKYQIDHFGTHELEEAYDWAYEVINARTSNVDGNQLSEKMKLGAKNLSWKISPLERSDDVAGRRSMTATLLKSALSKGLRLITRCTAIKIFLKADKAKYVEVVAIDSNERKVNSRIIFRDIFIACGAVNTPKLLLASGIKKNIGKSIRFHPTLKALALFPDQINAKDHVIGPHAITEFMPNIRLGCSVFRPGFFGMALAEDWGNRGHLKDSIDYCGIYYAMIRASGSGKVLSIPGLRDPLTIYKFTKSDQILLKEGLINLAKLLFAAGALEVFPSISGHKGWKNIDDVMIDSALNNLEKKANPFSIHVFSSCPMGEDLTRCATNSYGKVHGFKNIYISDASLIPEAPGVNPQGSIMALAYRNSLNYLENTRL